MAKSSKGDKRSSLASAPPTKGEYPAILRAHFCYCFSKAAVRLRSMLDQKMEPHGLVIIQFGILSMLSKTGPMSQIELGNMMGIDKASVVKFVDTLETRGYLERTEHETDRRVRRLRITKTGESIRKKLSDLVEEAQEEFLGPLSSAERKVVLLAVPKLLGTPER